MYLVLTVLLIPVIISGLLQIRPVQTYVAKKVASYLSVKTGSEISIGTLSITNFNDIILENLVILDHRDSLLLDARVLTADIGRIRFRDHSLTINSILAELMDFRLKKYESDSLLNLTRFLSVFSSGDTTSRKPGKPWTVTCGALEVKNGHFSLKDCNKVNPPRPWVNFSDLDLDTLNLYVNQINIKGDTISGQINKLQFHDKSGLDLKALNAFFEISPGFIHAVSARMVTNDSNLDFDLAFEFEDFSAFSDFLHKVSIRSDIRSSSLASRDLAYFVPSLINLSHNIDLSGEVRGTVSNLKIRNLFLFYGSMTNLYGDISMNGLPDIKETFIHMKISNCNTCISDIQQLLADGVSPRTVLPENLSPLGNIHFAGRFTGFVNDFVSFADFRSDLGTVSTDLALQATPSRKGIQYKGKLIARQFDVGRISNLQDKLGLISLRAEITGSGTTKQSARIQMDGSIDSVDFNAHRYRDIYLNGVFNDQQFNGIANIDDPFLHLTFKGMIDLKNKIPQFDFSAEINNARLHDIGLIDSLGILSTRMTMQLGGTSLDSTYGQVKLDSTVFVTGRSRFTMDHFSLAAFQEGPSDKSIELKSDYIDAYMKGNFLLGQLYPALEQIIDPHISIFRKDTVMPAEPLKDQDFIFNIDLKNTHPVTDLLLPDLSVAAGTLIKGSFNLQRSDIQLNMKSGSLSYKSMNVIDFIADARTSSEKLEWDMKAGKFSLEDPSAGGSPSSFLEDLRVSADIELDTLSLGVLWDDSKDPDINKGSLATRIELGGLPRIEGRITSGSFLVNGARWNIASNNYFMVDSSYIRIDQLDISGEQQKLVINGTVSSNPEDILEVTFNPFDLVNLQPVLRKSGFIFEGLAYGRTAVADVFKNPTLISDLTVRDFTLNDELLGDLQVKTEWDNTTNKINTFGEISYTGNNTTVKVVTLNGSYAPSSKTENFDFSIAMENLKVKPIGHFLQGIFSEFGGYATGNLYLKGNKEHPLFTGQLSVRRGQLRVGFLNTKYTFSDNIYFEPDHITFQMMSFNDTLGNTGTVNGSIYHRFFKDFALDLEIQTSDLIGINTTVVQSPYFYGTGVATGKVTIRGPVDNLVFDIMATTGQGTAMYLPISYTADVSDNPYIVFVSQSDIAESAVTPPRPQSGGMNLNLAVQVTDNATMQIFLPTQMGNIKVKGNGLIRLNMVPSGELGLSGTYIMESGTFYFTLKNLISRTFHIKSGSTISWSGDMYGADINLKAVYQVKPSLSTLPVTSLTDSSFYNQRIPVDCVIGLTGDLFNPTIRFGLEMPDVREEAIRNLVYNSIDTTNEAQLNQQMLSLLVLNSFSLNTGSSIAGSMGISSYDLLANQLNSWLSQISDDFDIGVNYEKGNTMTPEQLEVALSTQLFNDRVSVSGNFGVGNYNTSEKTSNIVGDVLVEARITKDGRLKLRAYNKTNTYDLFNDNAPYTQGVGLSYRNDFNKIKELFQSKRKKKTTNDKSKLP